MREKIRQLMAKGNEKQFVSILSLFMILLGVAVIIYASAMLYFSDRRKIEAKRSEIVALENELNDATMRFTQLQKQYDDLSKQLRALEVQRAADTHKREMYEPIIKSAFKYVDSDLNYLNLEFVDTVFTLAANKNVNPYVIFAIIDVESNFNARARNRSGAIGLGQIMPTTGSYIRKSIMRRTDTYSHESLLSPALNVTYMIEYVSHLVKSRGTYDSALALYCGSLIKGKEKFYPNYYRNRLIDSMRGFGISAENANLILKGK